MRVTVRLLKIRAAWEVFKNLPMILKYHYHEFLLPMVQALHRNPNIKW